MRVLFSIVFAYLFVTVPSATAQQADSASHLATVTFVYENTATVPNHYLITIHEDGSGSYESSDGIPIGPAVSQGKPFQQEITITSGLLTTLFSTARAQKYFAIQCEYKNGSKIAFQGKKTLTYSGPDGTGSCSFNYSQNKHIQDVGEDMQSIASTMEAGHRLLLEHQYDRLGIDAELSWLMQSVNEGHSIEVQNIRPILEEISSDSGVLNRARQHATLLASGKTR